MKKVNSLRQLLNSPKQAIKAGLDKRRAFRHETLQAKKHSGKNITLPLKLGNVSGINRAFGMITDVLDPIERTSRRR